ncbi:transposase, partial [Streptomyces sp. NPDC001276]|uniref:transposase n=1 Tax=Streptomyces sp. NPDC001276 TaxID=3364555 RepID=UPI0036844643
MHLERIDQIKTAITELSARIEEEMRPFARQLDLLETIPGVGKAVAEVLIAETGADMARFRTAGHLASWAGVCPGHHESAGKHKSGRRRHGNRWLGAALGTAAMAASRTRDRTYPGARYMPLMPRLGKKKALVALEHTLLTAVWHILTTDSPFHDLGGDYYTKHDPARALRRITRQANALGLTVRFEPIGA